MTKEAFGMYFVIDPTGGGQLQIAMSPELPKTVDEELLIIGECDSLLYQCHSNLGNE